VIRSERLRLIVAVLAALAPARVRRSLLTALLGYEIAPDARVGRSIVAVDQLVMGSGASIGSLCLIRKCERVELREHAAIGFLVWVNAVARSKGYFDGQRRELRLTLGDRAAITCLHFVDCSDRVDIGALSTVAGLGSQILTHSIDIAAGRQVARPVRIGERVFVGTRAVILGGADVASRAVIGAGSVVRGKLAEECALYAGVPATWRRSLDPGSRYFTRAEAHVH